MWRPPSAASNATYTTGYRPEWWPSPWNLTMLNETLGHDITQDSRRLLTAARDHAKDALVELRDMVGNIHPPALDGGLETALLTLAARSPIPVDLQADLPERPTAASRR